MVIDPDDAAAVIGARLRMGEGKLVKPFLRSKVTVKANINAAI